MGIVTPEIVKQVARLARLRLEGEELTHLVGQLDEILGYVQQLQAVATDQVEPTSHVLPLANVMHKDALQPCLPQAAVLALAPSQKAPFITVPKVLDT